MSPFDDEDDMLSNVRGSDAWAEVPTYLRTYTYVHTSRGLSDCHTRVLFLSLER